LRDEDDTFDPTYATFYFSVPESFKPLIDDLKAVDATPEQRWKSFISKLQDPTKDDDPQIVRVREAFDPILNKLKEIVKKDKTVTIIDEDKK
jgi:UDP:flavonoid glycosyltransferase YjiC (YdhE family)